MNFLKRKASQFYLEVDDSRLPDEEETSGIVWKNRTNVVPLFQHTTFNKTRIFYNRLKLQLWQLQLE